MRGAGPPVSGGPEEVAVGGAAVDLRFAVLTPLPRVSPSRIMKRALPGNAKIAKDAKETVQECVSEFISFITSECVARRGAVQGWAQRGLRLEAPSRRPRRASDKCQREKRKTINGDDLLWAMTTLGFEAYVEPLRGASAEQTKRARLALASPRPLICPDTRRVAPVAHASCAVYLQKYRDVRGHWAAPSASPVASRQRCAFEALPAPHC